MLEASLLGVVLFLGLAAPAPAETPAEAAQRQHQEGITLAQKGQLDQAITELETARQLLPDDPRILNTLGGLLTRKGDAGGAEKHFRRALEIEPSLDPARKSLAIVYFLGGRYGEATPHLKKLTESAATRTLAELLLGIIAAEEGRYEEAVGLLEAAASLAHQQPRAILLLARSYGETRQPEKIPPLLERLETLPTLTREEHMEAAALYANLEQDAAALRHAGAAAQRAEKPAAEDYYLGLSLLYVEQGNSEHAEEIINAGLGRLPDSYRLLVRKGAILEGASKTEEAIQTFRKAMSLEQDHQLALAGLASTLTNGGEIEQALEILRAGTERFPDDFYLHYLRGYALQASLPSAEDKAAVSAKAATALERSVELNPNHADSHHWLGKIYADSDPQKAVQSFETALRLDPSHRTSKYLLARLYLKLGKREEGRRLMAEVRQAKRNQSGEDRNDRLTIPRP